MTFSLLCFRIEAQAKCGAVLGMAFPDLIRRIHRNDQGRNGELT